MSDMSIKKILWGLKDKPIPRKGETIENAWHEKFKVLSVVKGRHEYTIKLEPQNL